MPNSPEIARNATMRGLALQLYGQDFTQSAALAETWRLLLLVEQASSEEPIRVMARMAQDQVRKAQDCEAEDIANHRKLFDLLDIELPEPKGEGR